MSSAKRYVKQPVKARQRRRTAHERGARDHRQAPQAAAALPRRHLPIVAPDPRARGQYRAGRAVSDAGVCVNARTCTCG